MEMGYNALAESRDELMNALLDQRAPNPAAMRAAHYLLTHACDALLKRGELTLTKASEVSDPFVLYWANGDEGFDEVADEYQAALKARDAHDAAEQLEIEEAEREFG